MLDSLRLLLLLSICYFLCWMGRGDQPETYFLKALFLSEHSKRAEHPHPHPQIPVSPKSQAQSQFQQLDNITDCQIQRLTVDIVHSMCCAMCFDVRQKQNKNDERYKVVIQIFFTFVASNVDISQRPKSVFIFLVQIFWLLSQKFLRCLIHTFFEL